MGILQSSASGELRIPIVSKFLHGYAVSFRVWFEGDLDHRNWVWDFGGMKRAKHNIDYRTPNDYFLNIY